MTYSWLAALGVVLATALDLVVVRTMLLRSKAFWTAYVIMLFFQLIVNGVLTGVPVVRYDPSEILGWRIAHAPVEDVLFGFALVLITLTIWVRLGARGSHRAGR